MKKIKDLTREDMGDLSGILAVLEYSYKEKYKDREDDEVIKSYTNGAEQIRAILLELALKAKR